MEITQIDSIDAEVLNGLTVSQVATVTEVHKELHLIWKQALDKTVRLLSQMKEALPAKNWMAFCKHCLPSNLSYKTVQRLLRAQDFIESTEVPQAVLADMSAEAVAQIAAAPPDEREAIEAELIESGEKLTIAEVEQRLQKEPKKQTATQRIVQLEETLSATQAENDRLRLENQHLRQQLQQPLQTEDDRFDAVLDESGQIVGMVDEHGEEVSTDELIPAFQEMKQLIRQMVAIHKREFDPAKSQLTEYCWESLSAAYHDLKYFADIRWQNRRARNEAAIAGTLATSAEASDDAADPEQPAARPNLTKAQKLLAQAKERMEKAEARWEEVKAKPAATAEECVEGMLEGIQMMATAKAETIKRLVSATGDERERLKAALDEMDAAIPDAFADAADPDDPEVAELIQVVREKVEGYVAELLEDKTDAE